MWKQLGLLSIATLMLAACSDDSGTYVYRPADAAPLGRFASQGNATNDALPGGLAAGTEAGGGANAGPATGL